MSILIIVGPQGVGKSTLVRGIHGILGNEYESDETGEFDPYDPSCAKILRAISKDLNGAICTTVPVRAWPEELQQLVVGATVVEISDCHVIHDVTYHT